VATLLPSVFFLLGLLTLDQVKLWTLVATVIWFVVTPLWMGRERGQLAPTSDK
jgi:ACR3 family arsenite efflux pump ArsB